MRNLKKLSLFPQASKKRGSILMVAVGTIVVLSVLAAGAASSVTQELKLSSFLTDSNTSFYYGLSIIRAMKTYWEYGSEVLALSLHQLSSRTFEFGERTVDAVFVDEESFINVAGSPAELLLKVPGIDGNEDLVNQILAHPPVFKEDLLSYNGMSPEQYDLMKNVITVYGDSRININTAANNVLLVLGCPEALIVKIREFRSGEDGQEGTKDDRVFEDVTKICENLEPFGLTSAERAIMQALITSQRLKTFSGNVRFEMIVRQGDRSLRKIQAVLELASMQIRRWDEQ